MAPGHSSESNARAFQRSASAVDRDGGGRKMHEHGRKPARAVWCSEREFAPCNAWSVGPFAGEWSSSNDVRQWPSA